MDNIDKLFAEYELLLEKGMSEKEVLADFKSYLHPISYSRLLKAIDLKEEAIGAFIHEQHRRQRS